MDMKKYWRILSVFCSILGVFISFYSSRCQLGLTYDSYDYLASAKSFTEKGILLTQHDTSHVIRTPLFSIILSSFGNNVLFLSKIFQLICLFITLNIFIKLGTRYISYFFLKVVYIFILTVGTPLYHIHHFLWSEALFLALLAGILFLFVEISENKALENNKSLYIFLLVVLSTLLTLQKNTGVIFIVVLGIIFFVAHPSLWTNVLLFSFLSLFCWIIWTIGTLWINTEGVHPVLVDFDTSLWQRQNILGYIDVISRWFIPSIIPFPIRFIFMLLLVLGLSFSFLKNFEHKQTIFSLWIMILFYLSVMQLTEKVDFEEVQRYAAIIFPLFILVLFILMDKVIFIDGKSIFKYLLVFLLINWLLYSGLRTYKNVAFWSERSCENVENS